MPTENRSSNIEAVSAPREHELKIRQTPLADLLSGLKTGEVRDCSDREFAVGDTVLLREIDDARDYTGTVARRTITHVQKNYGLPDHLCVLSYGKPIDDQADLDFMDPRRAKLLSEGRAQGLNEASELCARMGYDAYFPAGTRYRAFVPKGRAALGDLLIKAANAIADLPDGPYERFKARQAKKKS
ncbi:MAG: DUF3850 domain-containing protein [Paucimonas sp.]|jgi:hypothetical protein|nr:DUF3850 domain-containing protein [Paucimonas sp.]